MVTGARENMPPASDPFARQVDTCNTREDASFVVVFFVAPTAVFVKAHFPVKFTYKSINYCTMISRKFGIRHLPAESVNLRHGIYQPNL